jgi:FKBP-type peptidyl-prolyl cis-trans isomerase FkpA
MKHRIIFQIAGSVLIALALTNCFSPPDIPTPEELLQQNIQGADKARLQADLQIIDDSLQKWSILPLTEPHGVRYTISSVGNGTAPTLSSYISVRYVGKLLSNQSVFDQNNAALFKLSDLIIGWQTTLPLLTEGTRATLYIPSGFAYGSNPVYDANQVNIIVPANSNLIFEIEILDVL